jgi:hypothetical protein
LRKPTIRNIPAAPICKIHNPTLIIFPVEADPNLEPAIIVRDIN